MSHLHEQHSIIATNIQAASFLVLEDETMTLADFHLFGPIKWNIAGQCASILVGFRDPGANP